ncbi:MAG: hypothetical protein GY822_21955 [Deltaproteobacteria bacterium]|nr:hypothetical protein [Deltaproteobacteria bacterium]
MSMRNKFLCILSILSISVCFAGTALANDPQPPSSTAENETDPCADHFDSSHFDSKAACAPLEEDPLATPGEPLSKREDVALGYEDEAEDPSIMGWRLVAAGGISAVIGLGFQAASLAYYQSIVNPPSRVVGAQELHSRLKGMVFAGGASLVSFVVSTLFVGSGLAFFTFDPRTGKLRFPDPEKR